MSFFGDMPRVTDYDKDLFWLIKSYRKYGEAIDDLQNRVKSLEDLYDSIQPQIDEAINKMKAEVNVAIADMEAKLDAEVVEVNATLKEFETKFNQMVAEFNSLWAQISKYVDSSVDGMKAWVKAYLEDFAKDYPWLICPVDGALEPLQEILWHLYNELGFGITVSEFDGMQLTAQDLDEMQIPARKLDRWGKILFMQRKFCYMFSPFTGEYVPISEVVLGLARFHQNAVTAGEFDQADLDVEMVDEKNVSAYDWDWTSVWFDEISGATA